MKKQFLYFVLTFQSIITGLHLIIFYLLVLFFPELNNNWKTLLTGLILMSFSFLTFTTLSHIYLNKFVTWGNRLAGIWTVTAFYFLVFSIPSLLAYLFNLISLQDAGFLTLFGSFALVIYGLINARITRIIRINISLPNLPDFWHNKHAVMVSDLHLGKILGKNFAKKIVQLINQEDPHIVLIPGDFYDGEKANFKALSEPFKNIKAPLGTYFASGNHEKIAGYRECENAILEAGIKILENEKVEIEGLEIGGLAYKSEKQPNLLSLIDSLNFSSNKPSILMKHVPSQVHEVKNTKVDLMLSGHTHLGQIWPGRYITKKVYEGFDYGLKVIEDLQVFTSSGAGSWGPPVRVFTRSEIIKITFTKK